MPARILVTICRDGGAAGSARKLSAAIRLALPVLAGRRRTAAGVGAYFDLIIDDARLFYGDSFHIGYFRSGSETLTEALDAHTDLVGGMARLQARQLVLDAGCGIGAPALRIAERYGCEITGVNISREQVRQGRRLIEERRMSQRVVSRPPATSASASRTRTGLSAAFTGLRPGGHVGFSDLAPSARASQEETTR